MKGQNQENNLEAMKIHLNQILCDCAMLFWKYILSDSWGIAVIDVLLRRNGVRTEEDS